VESFEITAQEAFFRYILLVGLLIGELSVTRLDLLPQGTMNMEVGFKTAAPGNLAPLCDSLAVMALLLPATSIRKAEFGILTRITGTSQPPAPPPGKDDGQETPPPR